jgi:hypothetical protein
VADADLSAIKALSRTDSAVRNVAQGTAGAAVKALDAQVVARASKAGPDALKALKAGRAATIQKYVASDLLDTIRAEPVGAFRDVTAANDAHIVKLRQIDKAAPGTAAQVGRAYLDSLLNMAQAEGGFQRAAKLQAEWRKLGPETKRLLFKDPAYIQDLDDFFLLAKRIGDNPNPSGSGYMGGLIGRAYLGFDPISQVGYELTGAALTTALHSPAVVKLLTKGMKLPVKSAMGPAWFGSLVAATQAEGIPLEEAKQ